MLKVSVCFWMKLTLLLTFAVVYDIAVAVRIPDDVEDKEKLGENDETNIGGNNPGAKHLGDKPNSGNNDQPYNSRLLDSIMDPNKENKRGPEKVSYEIDSINRKVVNMFNFIKSQFSDDNKDEEVQSLLKALENSVNEFQSNSKQIKESINRISTSRP